jgi:pSer/pThr/pTyr-binding forkhead associated (FHA) protein
MTDTTGWMLLALRLGLVLALYAFLAWSLLLLWREFKAHSQQRRSAIPTLILTSQTGDPPDVWRFTQPPVTIGRSPACEFHLADDAVSSQHARLYYQDGHWWLEDLNSRNGTHLNNAQLISPTILAINDELRCGDTTFKIRFERP